MSKAEEILTSEFAGKFSNDLLRTRVLSCINDALEWAAQQCEARVIATKSGEIFAEQIRAGKSA